MANSEPHADVQGEKLRGRLVLVRRGEGRSRRLLHKDDDLAVGGWDPEEHPESVKSGRINDEVAAKPTATWRADLPASEAELVLGEPTGAASSSFVWTDPTEDELAALDDLPASGQWSIDGRDVRLSNLDKVMFPATDQQTAVTKCALIRSTPLSLPRCCRTRRGGRSMRIERPTEWAALPSGGRRCRCTRRSG